MRQPIRTKAPRAQNVDVFSTPAPVGGWNSRDALANMPIGDAVKLLNLFPRTSDVELRGGHQSYATGITGLVETLAVYNKVDGRKNMFAATETGIYDVTAAGTASLSYATGTLARYQSINFGDGTTNYLIMVNGADDPLYYNGTSWIAVGAGTSPALTGVSSRTLVHVTEYKGRLIFIEKDSLSFWYLPSGAAGGELTEFDLSSFCSRGGYLMWCAPWSFDGGDGPDDACVFMTSEGEVVVYRGTDPSTASDWVLTGVYFVGKPLGRRSFVKYGGDLLAIIQNGVFPLSAALQDAMIDTTFALSNKIENAFNEKSAIHGENFGWEAVLYPKEDALIFNIPVEMGGEHRQYVMNTITKSWCEFDSWNGECFVEYGKEIYFGHNAGVSKAWTPTDDNGSDIVGEGRAAFNYFGNTSQQKQFKLFRPLVRVNGNFAYYTHLDMDFEQGEMSNLLSFTAPAAALWGTAVWDTAKWTGELLVVRQWGSPPDNVGYSASGGVKIESDSLRFRWISSDYLYERGGVL